MASKRCKLSASLFVTRWRRPSETFPGLIKPYWQSGFPKFVNGIGIPAFERHLERVIENEHRRFPADLKAWRERAKSKNSP